MSTQSILEWVVCVTSNLLPSQSATLAALVAAAVRTERLNLATIGRKMAGAGRRQAHHQAGLAVHLQPPRRGPSGHGRRRQEADPQAEEAADRQLRLDRRPRLPHPHGRRLHRRPGRAAGLGQLHRGVAEAEPEQPGGAALAQAPRPDPGVGPGDDPGRPRLRPGRVGGGLPGAEVPLRGADQARRDDLLLAVSRGAEEVSDEEGDGPPAQGRRLPQGQAGPAQHRDPLAARPAQEAGRAVVPDDRPGPQGRADLPALRPADEHRGAVPRRQEQAERPVAEGHQDRQAGPIRPVPAGGGVGVPGAGGPGAAGEARLRPVGVVHDATARGSAACSRSARRWSIGSTAHPIRSYR